MNAFTQRLDHQDQNSHAGVLIMSTDQALLYVIPPAKICNWLNMIWCKGIIYIFEHLILLCGSEVLGASGGLLGDMSLPGLYASPPGLYACKGYY